MNSENQVIEYKSLRKVQTGDAGFKDLATTCVCLANSQGGKIIVGWEDKTKIPPENQIITNDIINESIARLRSLCFNVGLSSSDIKVHCNGGQYFEVNVFPSLKSISTTSDGKIYMRTGDQCQPVRSEDILRLANEKEAFQWELVTSKTYTTSSLNNIDLENFVSDIRNSAKVSENIKNKTNGEILEYYNLTDNGYLTNLGILWLVTPKQRARLSYPITVQYIVYDNNEAKVRKEVWHDCNSNPKELILDIEKKAVELTYFHELPRGMFRDSIRLYPEKVVRELLVNAVAHKSYTISGDIFIEVFPDRMEITNPGGLPIGITRTNILHQRHRRNPHLINILHDLNLMEGEGSGYDMIYEVNSRLGKTFPDILSDFNSTKVIQEAKIMDEEILHLLSYITTHYQLKQKEVIALGIIVRHRKILTTELSKELQLSEENRLRAWVNELLSQQIIVSRGYKKGTEYLINSKLIAFAKVNIKPSLVTIEPYRLTALIEEDLKTYPNSLMNEIHNRFVDVSLKDLRKNVYKMVCDGILFHTSGRTYRRYSLAIKNRNEKEKEYRSD
jgi:ATP-dependent DNA helicase RecG